MLVKSLKVVVVSYATEVKAKLLHVSESTISTYGVVSEQCALEMATNVRTELDSDVGISFTGVAGPDEQEGKPAGTVFIGISYRDGRSHVESITLSGSRAQIRIKSVKYGCHYLLRDLQQL